MTLVSEITLVQNPAVEIEKNRELKRISKYSEEKNIEMRLSNHSEMTVHSTLQIVPAIRFKNTMCYESPAKKTHASFRHNTIVGYFNITLQTWHTVVCFLSARPI